MSSLVERLRATEFVGWQPSADGLSVAVKTPVNPDGPEAANEIERLETEKQVLLGQRLGILAMMYHVAPTTIAKMCDEDLDRSGALLGEVREMAREALSLHKGGRDGD